LLAAAVEGAGEVALYLELSRHTAGHGRAKSPRAWVAGMSCRSSGSRFVEDLELKDVFQGILADKSMYINARVIELFLYKNDF
jgi:hypothetical protein